MNGRSTWTSIAFAAMLLAACGGSDGADGSVAPASTSTTTTAAPFEPGSDAHDGATDRSTTTTASPDSVLRLALSEPELVLITDADVCGPTEPAVSVLTVTSDHELVDVRGRLRRADQDARPDPATSTTTDDDVTSTTVAGPDADVEAGVEGTLGVDLAPADDGSWSGVVGPLPARRNATDQTLHIDVVADLDDGTTLHADTTIAIVAPIRCGDGERPDRTSRRVGQLEVASEPADGRIVGAGTADCAGRPTTFGLGIRTRGPIVALRVDGTLPDGTVVERSVAPDDSRVRTSFGPFAASPTMPEETPFSLTVTAIDRHGQPLTETVSGVLVRPVPCSTVSSTTVDVDDTGTVDVDDTGLDISPSPLELWASADGACPDGPTTGVLTVRGAPAPPSVTIERGDERRAVAVVTDGDVVTATIGPFPASASMRDRSSFTVVVTILRESGDSVTRRIDGELRRPDRCADASGTTTVPPTATTVATTSTTTATTPATAPVTPTTSPPTTAAPSTAPAPISVSAAASPAQITAACPAGGGGTLTISASTTGPIDGVLATVSIGGRSQDIALNGGGGSWSGTFGPARASLTMPDSAPISISITARAVDGRTTSATASATLLRPTSC